MQLSARAKELIPKSRIISFATWQDSYRAKAIAIWQNADDQGRYLNDDDLEQIAKLSPENATGVQIAGLLRDQAHEIVAMARQCVLEQYPNITEPKGDLYPPERAIACWRDFWHFLRCITYGIAAEKIEFTSSEGLANMQLLYQELRVPIPAMVTGLENLKIYSLKQLDEEKQNKVAPYFDHLIKEMKKFR